TLRPGSRRFCPERITHWQRVNQRGGKCIGIVIGMVDPDQPRNVHGEDVPAIVKFPQRVQHVQADSAQEHREQLPQILLTADRAHEQDIEDADFQIVLHHGSSCFRPKAEEPTKQHDGGENAKRQVQAVANPLFFAQRPDGNRAKHVDAFDVQFADCRPNLERPVYEQPHVTAKQVDHGRPESPFSPSVNLTGRCRLTMQGLPTATERSGIGVTTTLPAPIMQSSPMSAITTVLLPIQVLRPMRTCRNWRGCSWIGSRKSSNPCCRRPLRMSTLLPMVTSSSILAHPSVQRIPIYTRWPI